VNGECELSLRLHRTRTTKYNRLAYKFRHRSTIFIARHRPITVFTVEKIQQRARPKINNAM